MASGSSSHAGSSSLAALVLRRPPSRKSCADARLSTAASVAYTFLDRAEAEYESLGDVVPIAKELQRRHEREQPYSWLNRRVMLSVNPGRPLLPSYAAGASTASTHADAAAARNDELLRPDGDEHIFRLAEAAARQAEEGIVSTVACAGESGSGKTEAAKLVLLHLMQRCSSAMQGGAGGDGAAGAEEHEQMHRAVSLTLLLARSVLETFGHAAGPANRNASRLVLHTCVDVRGSKHAGAGLLHGARLQATLMQTGRAASPPAQGHANFQLLCAAAASASPHELAGLALHELRLLMPEGGTAGAVSAAAGSPGIAGVPGFAGPTFETVGGALRALGMEEDLVEQLRQLLLGLLLLGQVDLSSPLLLQLAAAGRKASAVLSLPRAARSGRAESQPPPPPGAELLAQCEALLGCEALSELLIAAPDDPDGGMCGATSARGGDAADAPVRWRTAAEAAEARDAVVARAYEALFDAMLRWLNAALAEAAGQPPSKPMARRKGAGDGAVAVLDSPGLEGVGLGLPEPSLESLSANYLAERMRLGLLDLLLPPPPQHVLEDEGLLATKAHGRELGVEASALIHDIEAAFELLAGSVEDDEVGGGGDGGDGGGRRSQL
eukprot:207050-Prymnesium_polylepis.1